MYLLTRNAVQLFPYVAVLWISGLRAAFHLSTRCCAQGSKAIVIEVLSQLDAHSVRGIALTPTQGLARGMPVTDTHGPLMAPVGNATLSRMFDVFGNAIDRQPAPGSTSQWRTRPSFVTPASGAALHQVRNL